MDWNNDEDEMQFLDEENEPDLEEANPAPLEDMSYELQEGVVSGIRFCDTCKANRLHIYDIADKLKECDTYNIGGTFSANVPDFSFFFTTSNFSTGKYILNLFVCHRSTGLFKIRISDMVSVDKKAKKINLRYPKYLVWHGPLASKMFNSSEIDEKHYIRSFQISDSDLKKIQNLVIPIKIEKDVKDIINKDILMWIKANHNKKVFEMKKNTDFSIVSSSGTKYYLHKLLLVSHSPVLKEEVKKSKTNVLSLDIGDNDMSILQEFLYKNTIQNIDYNWQHILELAEKLQIDSLKRQAVMPIFKQISVENAVSFAVLSEKYSLDELQRSVFDFIKNNPEVLNTDSWNNLTDVKLTKKLLKEICTS